MNEQRFDSRMERRMERYRHRSAQGRRWVGLFLLLAGGLWLARVTGTIDFPRWFFTWPMILIGIGLLSGIRHGFRGIGWLFPIIIGGVFLVDQLSPDLRLKPYIWPMALILFGLLFILRPKKDHWRFADDGGREIKPIAESDEPHIKTEWQQAMNDGNEVIDATAIFGGVKKNVLSKAFKGGDVTTFMGGAEINLTQADFSGRVMIDCFNMFGGTKLIVPADWEVQSGVVTIFGGIEDKRQPTQVNPGKVLYLDGTCIFGGIEIKSF